MSALYDLLVGRVSELVDLVLEITKDKFRQQTAVVLL
jgi:hypothetical protein